MSDKARNALIELVRRFGPEVATDLPRLRGLLRDFCPVAPAEVRLLLLAAEDRIPEMLQGIRLHGLPLEVRRMAAIKCLQETTHLAAPPAQWVVDSWAIALEIIPEGSAIPTSPLHSSLNTENFDPNDTSTEVSSAVAAVVKRWFQENEADRQENLAAAAEAERKHQEELAIAVATQQIVLPGNVTLDVLRCPEGTFMMGSPAGETGRESQETQHQVTLTKPFWMGKTPVTRVQWKALMGTNPSFFKVNDQPIENLSWDDAVLFCKKLTMCEAGRIPMGYEYRLPTEAEWEYACRAGATGPYAGSGCLDDMGWYNGNSGNSNHPVGQKQPNAWGLYDMHGNVWEWCQDWYGSYPACEVTDPAGPITGAQHVVRGGCSRSDAGNCRAAIRFRHMPGSRSINLGFRVALAPVTVR